MAGIADGLKHRRSGLKDVAVRTQVVRHEAHTVGVHDQAVDIADGTAVRVVWCVATAL
jgi:hypothetical protein